MRISKYIPNTFTSLNLVAGCLGILQVFEGNIYQGAMFILVGSAFDFLDGFAAKMLNAKSEIGRHLDSLADLVTFGMLPAFLMYSLMGEHGLEVTRFISLLIVIASAFRLATFNIDRSQDIYFKGLPTPANAFLIAGIVFVRQAGWDFFSFIYDDQAGLIITVFISSFLLNAPLSFLSFKVTKFSYKGNEFILLLIVASLICFFFYGLKGILPATLVYILLSILHHYISKRTPS